MWIKDKGRSEDTLSETHQQPLQTTAEDIGRRGLSVCHERRVVEGCGHCKLCTYFLCLLTTCLYLCYVYLPESMGSYGSGNRKAISVGDERRVVKGGVPLGLSIIRFRVTQESPLRGHKTKRKDAKRQKRKDEWFKHRKKETNG